MSEEVKTLVSANRPELATVAGPSNSLVARCLAEVARSTSHPSGAMLRSVRSRVGYSEHLKVLRVLIEARELGRREPSTPAAEAKQNLLNRIRVFPRDLCAGGARVSIEDHATALRTLGN